MNFNYITKMNHYPNGKVTNNRDTLQFYQQNFLLLPLVNDHKKDS